MAIRTKVAWGLLGCGAWQDLLADQEIEAIYVATPPELHAPQTVAAAEAGRHVLC
jgi:predicted dehydrogenase